MKTENDITEEVVDKKTNTGQLLNIAKGGVSGGFTASSIVFIIILLFGKSFIEKDLLFSGLPWLFSIFISFLAIPVSLIFGYLIGLLSGIVSKTRKIAFIAGFLTVIILESIYLKNFI